MRLSCEETREDMVRSVFMSGPTVFGVLVNLQEAGRAVHRPLWYSKQTRGAISGKKGGDPFEKYLGQAFSNESPWTSKGSKDKFWGVLQCI